MDYNEARQIEREYTAIGTPAALKVAMLALALQELILAQAAATIGMKSQADKMREEAQKTIRRAK